MKRIHFKRKPPKVKRTVFDGTRTKTKYVRMTPVVAEDVKIEEVTHQNNEKRTFQTIFSCPGTLTINVKYVNFAIYNLSVVIMIH